MKNLLSRSLVLIVLFLMTVGCSLAPSSEEVSVREVTKEITRDITVEVTREITKEVIKEITKIIVETKEVLVPVTVTPSPTPKFTSTITQTPTITLIPTETATITPTITQTLPPGVGAVLPCGDDFLVTVLEQPRKETAFYGERAQGEFWLLKIEITNFLDETFDLNEDDFVIEAELDGKKMEFTSNWDITFDWVYHHYGQLIYPHDDLVAGLTAKVGIGFDVNPNAENFKLIWFPRDNMFDNRNEALCEVEIPLE